MNSYTRASLEANANKIGGLCGYVFTFSSILLFIVILIFPARWAIANTAITTTTTTPDFASMDFKQRRQTFIDTLLPLINTQNKNILITRQRLKKLAKKDSFSPEELTWIKSVAEEYDLSFIANTSIPSKQWFTAILERADQIPPSLVLAQAAIESAWGTSRFAREGNNYFGIWCFSKGCGIVPKQRSQGSTHEVRSFPSINASVMAYFKNINSHATYKPLRAIRAQERQKKLPLDSLILVKGLSGYSQIGETYVNSLIQWIKRNDLKKYDESGNSELEYEPYYQQAADLYNKK